MNDCIQAPTDFKTILNKLYRKTGRMEASFSSKLIATINPDMPIIDKVVLTNLGLKLPTANIKNRNEIICELYQILHEELQKILKTDSGRYVITKFKEEYKHAKITKIKMLDLVLWQIRS